MTFTESVLFGSDDLLVRKIASGGSDLCFVTFDSYTDNPSLDRPGFGQAYFHTRGIDAIHIISRENRWYQHAELSDALAATAGATAAYNQVFSYGSSMGGFAALNYGVMCGARAGIAISPQYSVDPQVVPFENRWSNEVGRIAFRREPIAPLPLQYVLYDPHDALDRAHYTLFAARSPTVGIRIPNGGHPVGGYLVETGSFDALFEGVRRGMLDATAFERDLRRRRRLSAQYLFTLSNRTPPYRSAQKLALARMAVKASPLDPGYVSHLAVVLDQVGQHAEAGPTHRRALAMAGRNLHILHNLMLHHEHVGELREARALADDLVASHPGRIMLEQSLDRIRREQRRLTPLGRLARLLRLEPVLDRATARRPAPSHGASS